MTASYVSKVNEPQSSSSSIEVALSRCETGSISGSSVVPLTLSSDPSGSDVAGLLQTMQGYIAMAERRRMEDIEFFQSQNAELQNRITKLEQENTQLQELGFALALENQYCREQVESIRAERVKERTEMLMKRIAGIEASSSRDGTISGVGIGFFASIVGFAAGGPLAGLLSFTFPTFVGVKVDEIREKNIEKEYVKFLLDMRNEYLANHPTQYVKAYVYAKQKFAEKLHLN